MSAEPTGEHKEAWMKGAESGPATALALCIETIENLRREIGVDGIHETIALVDRKDRQISHLVELIKEIHGLARKKYPNKKYALESALYWIARKCEHQFPELEPSHVVEDQESPTKEDRE